VLKRLIGIVSIMVLCTSLLSCNNNISKKNQYIDNNVQAEENSLKFKEVDINKKDKNTVLLKASKEQVGAFTEIAYASKDRVIINSDFSLMVFNLNEEKIIRAIDLKEIDMNHMQGDIVTIVRVKNDGSEVLMYNDAFYINEEAKKNNPCDDKSIYLYKVEDDTLNKINTNNMDDYYDGKREEDYIGSDNNTYLSKYKDWHNLDCRHIDEKNICFLLQNNEDSGKVGFSRFKILIVNTETNEEKVYSYLNKEGAV